MPNIDWQLDAIRRLIRQLLKQFIVVLKAAHEENRNAVFETKDHYNPNLYLYFQKSSSVFLKIPVSGKFTPDCFELFIFV